MRRLDCSHLFPLEHLHSYRDPGNFLMCTFSCKKMRNEFSRRITPTVKML
jgi:hypothetical protein